MLILLSPAKTLDATPRPTLRGLTHPRFLAESATLVDRMKTLSRSELQQLLGVSDALTDENFARLRAWRQPFTPQNAVPAMYLFRGDVYQGLRADNLDARAVTFAQKHLRILSGLYGVLRPLDLVQPYRLEMSTRFNGEARAEGLPDTLYEFWGDRVTGALRDDAPTRAVVNLASNEYFRVVNPEDMPVRVITPAFKEEGRDGTFKLVSFFAKRARGLMARFLIDRRSRRPADLLAFADEGYRYTPELSSADAPVFTRRRD